MSTEFYIVLLLYIIILVILFILLMVYRNDNSKYGTLFTTFGVVLIAGILILVPWAAFSNPY